MVVAWEKGRAGRCRECSQVRDGVSKKNAHACVGSSQVYLGMYIFTSLDILATHLLQFWAKTLLMMIEREGDGVSKKCTRLR